YRDRFPRQQILVAGYSDEPRAMLDPFLGVRFGKREDTRGLARLLDPRDGVGDGGLHLWMRGVREMAEVSGQILRPDEKAIDSVDRGHLLDLCQRRTRLHLEDETKLLLGSLEVVGHAPKA